MALLASLLPAGGCGSSWPARHGSPPCVQPRSERHWQTPVLWLGHVRTGDRARRPNRTGRGRSPGVRARARSARALRGARALARARPYLSAERARAVERGVARRHRGRGAGGARGDQPVRDPAARGPRNPRGILAPRRVPAARWRRFELAVARGRRRGVAHPARARSQARAAAPPRRATGSRWRSSIAARSSAACSASAIRSRTSPGWSRARRSRSRSGTTCSPPIRTRLRRSRRSPRRDTA